MRRRGLALALGAALVAAPVGATGTIACSGPGASVSLGIGTLPVLAIISARIEAGGDLWTLEGAGEGTPVVVGQAARTERWTVVDFADPNLTGIVAELRLLRATEGHDTAEVGTLRLPGRGGVHALVCEGP